MIEITKKQFETIKLHGKRKCIHKDDNTSIYVLIVDEKTVAECYVNGEKVNYYAEPWTIEMYGEKVLGATVITCEEYDRMRLENWPHVIESQSYNYFAQENEVKIISHVHHKWVKVAMCKTYDRGKVFYRLDGDS